MGGVAGVLGADRRHTLQDVLRARRQIAEIADRRGDHVQVRGGNFGGAAHGETQIGRVILCIMVLKQILPKTLLLLPLLLYACAAPQSPTPARTPPPRSEERRVGKEGVSTCSSRWSRYH